MANLGVKVTHFLEKFYNIKEDINIKGLYEIREKDEPNGDLLWYVFSSNNATYHSSGKDCVIRDINQSNSAYFDRLKGAFEKANEENKKIFWLVLVYGDGIGLSPTGYDWIASVELKVSLDSITASLNMKYYPVGKGYNGYFEPCYKRIDQNKYFNTSFISCKDKNGEFTSEYINAYFNIYDNRPYRYTIVDDAETDENNLVKDIELLRGENILLYGVPGCGKSHYIKQNYCRDEKYMERIVFHPDYTYSDFIGQILPVSKEGVISYPFTPGPFTRIMKKAENDKDNYYYLIIEEINRGNAPAIFGEVFQLLDRNENGESDYGINNADIAKEVYGDETYSVKIPKNLFILATMNTADQNVFTLDTAFKRRWRLKSVKNDVDNAVHANSSICNTKVVWGEFTKKINDKIIELGEGNLGSEDNRLGAYFLKPEDLHDEETFAEKVLMYLWNDAFKFDKTEVFKPQYRTLEDLIEGFKSVKFEVFSDDFNFDSTLVGTDLQDVTVDEYLSDKEENMISLYEELMKLVKDKINNVTAYSIPSKAYIGLSVPNMKRSNFVDLDLKKDKIVVSCEKPNDPSLEALVDSKSDKGAYNHNYRYYLSDEKQLSEAVQIIIESYDILKLGE